MNDIKNTNSPKESSHYTSSGNFPFSFPSKVKDDSLLIPSSLEPKQDNIIIVLYQQSKYLGSVILSCKKAPKPMEVYFTIEKLIQPKHYYLQLSCLRYLKRLIPQRNQNSDSGMKIMTEESFVFFESQETLQLNSIYAVAIDNGVRRSAQKQLDEFRGRMKNQKSRQTSSEKIFEDHYQALLEHEKAEELMRASAISLNAVLNLDFEAPSSFNI